MPDNTISIEKFYEIWDDKLGVRIRVGPDSDGAGMVRISTPADADKKYFGEIDFQISPDIALKLADVLRSCSIEVRNG